jgi:hypothetical protein
MPVAKSVCLNELPPITNYLSSHNIAKGSKATVAIAGGFTGGFPIKFDYVNTIYA